MAEGDAGSSTQAGKELFLISLLLLFLELTCIRWFPAHVLFLTFFTNTVLLASFLGMSLGCLGASHRRNYLAWTPLLLTVALAAGNGVEYLQNQFLQLVDVGNQTSPQVVFFGTDYYQPDLARFYLPVEVLGGVFFLLIALVFIGPGQELGRAFQRVPDRVRAYTINILGSIAGILLFAACSWLELPPLVWFLLTAMGLGYFLLPRVAGQRWIVSAAGWTLPLIAVVVLAALPVQRLSKGGEQDQQFWSPYYRVDYSSGKRSIDVNLLGHQTMVAVEGGSLAYPLPYLLRRDSGGEPFKEVLIVGAGSGNDVSWALYFGASSIDAVEIDPVIQRLGTRDHPDRPYSDPRVTVHLDDGRNFLRATDRQYDLIVYALVDSLVLHSSYSNLRLESYLFTRQAFEDVKKHLKPDGLFVMYNYFRQGWIMVRLYQELEEVFGPNNPLLLTFPPLDTVKSGDALFSYYATFISGDTLPLQQAFARSADYWIRPRQKLGPSSPNGFDHPPVDERQRWLQLSMDQKEKDWWCFRPAEVVPPREPLRPATDAWPYLYLRQPMIPDLSLHGMLLMGGLAAALIFLFLPRGEKGRRWSFDGPMFFLGAGFMLIETKAVVNMALLWGSTWMVNSVVFLAVLLMILAANLLVLKFRPRRIWPFYLGLFLTLVLNSLIPLDYFLGLSRGVQAASSCLLVFTPILFAAVIFAVLFSRTIQPDRALGANIAGAMLGGLSENASMLMGFQHLVLVAMGYYLLALLTSKVTSSVVGSPAG